VANRVAKRGLANVRLVKADARLFLRDCVPDDSLNALHVYFPDPWWKMRHKKRRVFTDELAKQCQRVLKISGTLQLATDVEEYFGVITELIKANTRLKLLSAAERQMAIQTNFERKAKEQGRTVWRASFVR
jgi:tRNA (guanine-N7-)-methyltransferase